MNNDGNQAKRNVCDRWFLDSSTNPIFLSTVECWFCDVIIKQKFLLTCPLSRSLAFWGVRGLPPGRFPEVSKEGHDGWY